MGRRRGASGERATIYSPLTSARACVERHLPIVKGVVISGTGLPGVGIGLVGLAVLAATACSPGPSTTASALTSAGAPAKSGRASPSASGCAAHAAPGAQGGGDVAVPGDIPDSQAYVTYSSPGAYHLSVPEGWARSGAGAAVSFSEKLNSVRVQLVAVPSAPLVASAQSSEVGALAASTPCFQGARGEPGPTQGGTGGADHLPR